MRKRVLKIVGGVVGVLYFTMIAERHGVVARCLFARCVVAFARA